MQLQINAAQLTEKLLTGLTGQDLSLKQPHGGEQNRVWRERAQRCLPKKALPPRDNLEFISALAFVLLETGMFPCPFCTLFYFILLWQSFSTC